ncbi:MAG TPA: hypothetical protein VK206_07545 [Anaerolineales bacterium]|nr:hypothetical protein [Anaerolineales bacterium]
MKFQAIQTKSDELKIRLESKCYEEFNDVWKRVYLNARDYLAQQGLENVRIIQDAEPPMRDPKSRKFRNIWIENVNP